MSQGKPQFSPNPRDEPKRVRGGVKLSRPEPTFPESWAAQRLMRSVEPALPDQARRRGIQYAVLGQARPFQVRAGRVETAVQGHDPEPQTATIRVRTLAPEQWELVVSAMLEQARFTAALLAGDLPPEFEELFSRLGFRLAPGGEEAVRPSCTCGAGEGVDGSGEGGSESGLTGEGGSESRPTGSDSPAGRSLWCEHTACLAFLLADRLAREPLALLTFRGLPADDLLERIRRSRSASARGHRGLVVYAPVVPGVSDVPAAALEESAERFWASGGEPEGVDLPIEPPEVSHPLLRRLGPSPFVKGRFPLVGLLATCYDVISRRVLQAEQGEDEQ